jgi:hypothetical protein
MPKDEVEVVRVHLGSMKNKRDTMQQRDDAGRRRDDAEEEKWGRRY